MASNPNSKPLAVAARPSLVQKFAAKYNVEAEKLLTTLKHTAFKVKEGEVSNEQMMGLLIVADQYGLNPFTREIFAFPDKQNGIVPVVSVDGWNRIINEHSQYDGLEFRYSETRIEPGDKRCPGLKWSAFEWIECVISRKDRAQPFVIREFFEEVYRAPFKKGDYTIEGAWQSHPKRMLRHKALIQGSRLAFGFAGIYDEDEAMRIVERDVTPEGSHTIEPKAKPAYDPAAFAANLPKWRGIIAAGTKTADEIIATVESKGTLTDEQREAIREATLASLEDIAAMVASAEAATISQAEIEKHLGVEKLDGITVGQLWAAQAFIANPAGGAQ